jgi:hypothetical protein
MDPDDDLNGNGIIDGSEENNLTYHWDLPSGETHTGPELVYTTGDPGIYEIKLTIWDSDDGLRTEIVTVHVKGQDDTFYPLFSIVVLILLLSIPVLIVCFFIWHRFKYWRELKKIDEELKDLKEEVEDDSSKEKTPGEMIAEAKPGKVGTIEEIPLGEEEASEIIRDEQPPEKLDIEDEKRKK